VLTSTYFYFDRQFYKQTDGITIGSPLSPVIANFYMEGFEKKAIEQAAHKPTCWFIYVDDTFVIWPHGQEKLTEFLNHLHGLHNNIQFTTEKEEEGHLPFWDTYVHRKTDSPFVTESIASPPIPISTYIRTHITISQTNSQFSLP
jgi:hypothetical protein